MAAKDKTSVSNETGKSMDELVSESHASCISVSHDDSEFHHSAGDTTRCHKKITTVTDSEGPEAGTDDGFAAECHTVNNEEIVLPADCPDPECSLEANYNSSGKWTEADGKSDLYNHGGKSSLHGVFTQNSCETLMSHHIEGKPQNNYLFCIFGIFITLNLHHIN